MSSSGLDTASSREPNAGAGRAHQDSTHRERGIRDAYEATWVKISLGVALGLAVGYQLWRGGQLHDMQQAGMSGTFDYKSLQRVFRTNFTLETNMNWLPSNLTFPPFPGILSWPQFQSVNHTDEMPGARLAAQGVSAKYPVVIIPGFVTSGLELWQGHECADGLFRTRLWTALPMASSFFRSPRCWMKHLSLNFTSGLDPAGIKLRNAQGLDAVDFFFPGYDVWAKAIRALADIGYSSSSLIAVPYDWRLSIPNLEFRDGYFTRLRSEIELLKILYDEKVLLAAHSWGDNVARAFLHWMEIREPGWVDKHIAVHFNLAGPALGVPKALTSLLSGELRETAQLSGLAHFVGENLLGKEDRTLVWRTWGSGIGMLPVGGQAIWGNTTWAPDDLSPKRMLNQSYGAFLTVLETLKGSQNIKSADYMSRVSDKALTSPHNHTDETLRFVDIVEAVKELILDAGPKYLHHLKHWSSADMPRGMLDFLEERHGVQDWQPFTLNDSAIIRSGMELMDNSDEPTVLHAVRDTVQMFNPLKTPLPNAPNLRMYCAYGHGLPTERAYHYLHVPVEVDSEQCPAIDLQVESIHAGEQVAAGVNWNINSKAHQPKYSLENGVQFGNGDGTVPLVSLGAMCAGPWRGSKLNPHGVKVFSREYADQSAESSFTDIRGGPRASSHIELLGNYDVLTDLLYAAAGWHHQIDQDMFSSNIQEITARIESVDAYITNS